MQRKWVSHLSRKQGRETPVNDVTFFLDLPVILRDAHQQFILWPLKNFYKEGRPNHWCYTSSGDSLYHYYCSRVTSLHCPPPNPLFFPQPEPPAHFPTASTATSTSSMGSSENMEVDCNSNRINPSQLWPLQFVVVPSNSPICTQNFTEQGLGFSHLLDISLAFSWLPYYGASSGELCALLLRSDEHFSSSLLHVPLLKLLQ